jgi:hypothetical protein
MDQRPSLALPLPLTFAIWFELLRFPLLPPQIPDKTSGTSLLGPRLSTSPMSLGTAPFSPANRESDFPTNQEEPGGFV